MSKGALLIGQSGGATAVINASLVGAIEAGAGHFDRIIGMRDGMAGLLAENLIDLTHMPHEHLAALQQTPGSALGTSRLKANDDQIDLAVAILRQYEIRGVVLIGGNDSADSARKLQERTDGSIQVVLAPKTVDNDLLETDFCPGFPSAARFLANLVRDATWDSLSAPELYPVKLIEVPGRDAGWLPLSGTLGFTERDADIHPLVFLPEAPPESVETMVTAIVNRIETHGFVVAIVPETLRDAARESSRRGRARICRSVRASLLRLGRRRFGSGNPGGHRNSRSGRTARIGYPHVDLTGLAHRSELGVFEWSCGGACHVNRSGRSDGRHRAGRFVPTGIHHALRRSG